MEQRTARSEKCEAIWNSKPNRSQLSCFVLALASISINQHQKSISLLARASHVYTFNVSQASGYWFPPDGKFSINPVEAVWGWINLADRRFALLFKQPMHHVYLFRLLLYAEWIRNWLTKRNTKKLLAALNRFSLFSLLVFCRWKFAIVILEIFPKRFAFRMQHA